MGVRTKFIPFIRWSISCSGLLQLTHLVSPAPSEVGRANHPPAPNQGSASCFSHAYLVGASIKQQGSARPHETKIRTKYLTFPMGLNIVHVWLCVRWVHGCPSRSIQSFLMLLAFVLFVSFQLNQFYHTWCQPHVVASITSHCTRACTIHKIWLEDVGSNSNQSFPLFQLQFPRSHGPTFPKQSHNQNGFPP